MLLNVATKLFEQIKINRIFIKRILLILAPLLLKFHYEEFKSMSFESLHTHFVFDPQNEFLKEPLLFEEKPPLETIFIQLSGSEEFEERIRYNLGKMKIRSKFIYVTRNESSKHYFVKIYLSEGQKSSYNAYPLANYQTNSELAFLARSIFKTSLLFKISDVFYASFENSVDLTLRNDHTHILDLCHLIRHFSNIHSHYYGLYYYIPLSSKLIKAESLGRFIIVVLLTNILEVDLNINLISIMISAILFALAPLSCVFYLKSRGKAIHLFLFFIINFKFCFLYAILCYLYEFVSEIKKYIKNRK